MTGTLELIAGPMFSGKTTELLRRLKCESTIGFRVMYINHTLDIRGQHFSTHNELYADKIEGILFQQHVQLGDLSGYEDVDIIGIDEAQFFPDLTECVIDLVEKHKKHVIVAGLNGDFKRRPFGRILELEPLADSYTRLKSYCYDCSQKQTRTFALFSYRTDVSDDVVLAGGKGEYIPLCRSCYLTRSEVAVPAK